MSHKWKKTAGSRGLLGNFSLYFYFSETGEIVGQFFWISSRLELNELRGEVEIEGLTAKGAG